MRACELTICKREAMGRINMGSCQHCNGLPSAFAFLLSGNSFVFSTETATSTPLVAMCEQLKVDGKELLGNRQCSCDLLLSNTPTITTGRSLLYRPSTAFTPIKHPIN